MQNDVNAVVVKAMKATSAMSWEEAAPILYEAMDNIMEGELDVDDDEEGGDEDGETMGFDTSQLQQMQQEMMQQAMQSGTYKSVEASAGYLQSFEITGFIQQYGLTAEFNDILNYIVNQAYH